MSYSDHENINILTALLVAHGVRHAVVCPGARNAPLAHNLNECPEITCHAVTDERSAGFQAIGMAQVLQQPVAVCVTSGTALFDVAPAVAEAFYQQVPLVVISADRPPQWIGQQVGQTIMQPDALARFTRCSVHLPQPLTTEQRWHCNRLVNEALLQCRQGAPVHINVPLDEPLFSFTTQALPQQRVIAPLSLPACQDALTRVLQPFATAQRPMLLIGQMPRGMVDATLMQRLGERYVVLSEALGADDGGASLDEALPLIGDDDHYKPSHVIYMGGTLVSKRLRQWLSACDGCVMMQVDARDEVHDTFTHLTQLLHATPSAVLRVLAEQPASHHAEPFVNRWRALLQLVGSHYADLSPHFSQLLAVKLAEQAVGAMGRDQFIVHYANSQPVRLADIYARHHVSCNRGTNGIEGSLSAAVGAAAVTSSRRVLCVTGDLSFFYDQNALWNTHLHGNLRILLLNNGGGGIFRQLAGLEQSPARDALVAASHSTRAEGVCQQHGVSYRAAYGSQDLHAGITWLVQADAGDDDRPRLLEVVTHVDADQQAWTQARESLNHKYQSWKKDNGNP